MCVRGIVALEALRAVRAMNARRTHARAPNGNTVCGVRSVAGLMVDANPTCSPCRSALRLKAFVEDRVPAKERTALEERASIVAWLRAKVVFSLPRADIAGAIERGEHLE